MKLDKEEEDNVCTLEILSLHPSKYDINMDITW